MKKYQHGGVNIAVLFIMLVILGGASWIYFQSRIINQKNNQAPIPTSTLDLTENWNSFTNLNHTFKYPSEATAEAREDESIVHFMGQKQIDSGRTQTELFDGYSIRIGEIINDSKLTLEQLSKNERQNAQNNCLEREGGQVSQLETISISGRTGYQYFAVGCYVDYAETIVSFEDKFYRISQSYVGDVEDQKKYQKITNQILSTFKFTNQFQPPSNEQGDT